MLLFVDSRIGVVGFQGHVAIEASAYVDLLEGGISHVGNVEGLTNDTVEVDFTA